MLTTYNSLFFLLLVVCPFSNISLFSLLVRMFELHQYSLLLSSFANEQFRINNLSLGNIPNSSLPRLLDMGQCNDAYSAIQGDTLSVFFFLSTQDVFVSFDDVSSFPLHIFQLCHTSIRPLYVVALALSDALKTDVNSLPIHYAISWFEQKAVAVFLTMLHLGLQNIHLGATFSLILI